MRFERRALRHSEYHELGSYGVDRRLDRGERGVLAEVRDPSATARHRDSEHDQPEVVLLTGRACQNEGRSAAGAPPAGETEQSAAEQRRGEVLLRDRYVAARPPISEDPEIRQEHLAHDGLNGDSRDQSVERPVRAILVEAIERIAQLVGEAVEDRRLALGDSPARDRLSRRLGGREAARDQLLRAEDPRLVVVGVEPEPAGRPRRAQQPVPLLPGAKQLRRGAGPPGKLADPQVAARVRHWPEPYTISTEHSTKG